jgi:hypothetical protein
MYINPKTKPYPACGECRAMLIEQVTAHSEPQCDCRCKGDIYKAPEQHAATCPWRTKCPYASESEVPAAPPQPTLNAADQSARDAGCNCDRKIPYTDSSHARSCPLYWPVGGQNAAPPQQGSQASAHSPQVSTQTVDGWEIAAPPQQDVVEEMCEAAQKVADSLGVSHLKFGTTEWGKRIMTAALAVARRGWVPLSAVEKAIRAETDECSDVDNFVADVMERLTQPAERTEQERQKGDDPMKELPFQTFERVTHQVWPGGKSALVVSMLKLAGIDAEPGSAQANLQLQSKLDAE